MMDWFSTHRVPDHLLNFSKDARWYSEALLPSAFLASHRGDPLAESWTHADGVIGHFEIGKEGKTDLWLPQDGEHLVILEAKMFAPLSSGVTRAPYFDQAARTVACIAEVLKRVDRHPSELSHLGFYVLAPRSQVDQGVFNEGMDRESIRQKVERRVNDYRDHDEPKHRRHTTWLGDWFEPTLQQIDIDVLSWEQSIQTIAEHDSSSAGSIQEFYQQCARFGKQSDKMPS